MCIDILLLILTKDDLYVFDDDTRCYIYCSYAEDDDSDKLHQCKSSCFRQGEIFAANQLKGALYAISYIYNKSWAADRTVQSHILLIWHYYRHIKIIISQTQSHDKLSKINSLINCVDELN